MAATTLTAPVADPAPERGRLVKRHRIATRIWHWVSALAVFVLLMSGLMIFNAHPALYWGKYGANADTPWLMINSDANGGFVRLAGYRIPTDGVLGRWADGDGNMHTNAFPGWATIPSYYSLSGGRRWHFAFAWVLSLSLIAFLLTSLFNRHIKRDLAPTLEELKPAHIGQDIADHARLRFPKGEAALRYNILQKLSYVGVIFVLLPVMILTGLAMSPAMNAAWPWLTEIFAGRASARSIHFIAAALLALFILVHLIMVVLAGPFNEIRSMITGRFRIVPQPGDKA
uniref:cytochrome b/b6 domain-containing protein n=1 Tax=uncultured Sphingomonas sp. TaxID=158754 RepID=UPI0025D23A3D|nr:cytochrome b/b6 domain-containing protein [uncultured Sphingomonas sp.]